MQHYAGEQIAKSSTAGWIELGTTWIWHDNLFFEVNLKYHSNMIAKPGHRCSLC